jgi:RimJ/RimL family protein N-acetyltransferase
MQLRTERLTLRRAHEGDLDGLHAVLSDPQAMRYWSSLPHASLDETRAWLARMIEGGPDSDDFVIACEGRAVGKIGFWKGSEIGYFLARGLWGHGFASEAMQAMLAYGFGRRGFTAITADVDPRNTSSIVLLRRFGFRETGFAKDAWCIGGVHSDSIYLALGRAAWGALSVYPPLGSGAELTVKWRLLPDGV